jgi:hypothetical protein
MLEIHVRNTAYINDESKGGVYYGRGKRNKFKIKIIQLLGLTSQTLLF